MIPVFEKQISNGGTAYARWGENRDVTAILIHGVGLRAESWYRQVDALKGEFDLIVPDLPEHGSSQALQTSFDDLGLAHYVVSLRNFIEETVVADKPIILCGHSLGALISIELAAQLADSVVGLAALNTVFERSDEARQAVQARAAKLNQSDSIIGVQQTLQRWFSNSPTDDMKCYAQYCQHWLENNSVSGYAKAYKVFSDQYGARPSALNQLLCETAFMTGQNDPNSTAEMTLALKAHLNEFGQAKECKSLVVNDAGHMMPLTHPEPVVNELLAFKHPAHQSQRERVAS